MSSAEIVVEFFAVLAAVSVGLRVVDWVVLVEAV